MWVTESKRKEERCTFQWTNNFCAAIEAVTMDYDGYSGTGNNYYLTDAAKKNTAKPFWKVHLSLFLLLSVTHIYP